jgi:hypothetical protein
MKDEAPLTLSVPEAGRKYLSLSRSAAYAAAGRGEIPTTESANYCGCLWQRWKKYSPALRAVLALRDFALPLPREFGIHRQRPEGVHRR